MPKALMLDIDGVVITGRPTDGKVWHTSLKQDLGVNYNDILDQFFAPHWPFIVTGSADMQQLLSESLEYIKAPCSTKQFINYWFKMDSRINTPVVDIATYYRNKGIPVYLCTNQEPLRKQYLWQQIGLNRHFDGIFSSCDFQCAKPDVEYYQIIQKQLGIDTANDIIFFDDREKFVAGGLKAGWQAHVFTDHLQMETILKEQFND